MGLLRHAIRGGTERRDFGSELAKIPGPLDGWRSKAGPIVNEDTALAHIDVYKCVSLIADSIAMLPLRAHRKVASRNEAGRMVVHGEKVPAQPLLLTDPMPGDLAPEFSFKHRVIESLLIDGNTYNEAAAVDARGVVSVLMPIHPAKVRDVRVNERSGLVEYVMHDGGIMGSIRDGGTMVHWPGFIQPGKLKGVSPIKAGMQGIALSMAAEEFGARWFGDGANPSGYLKHAENKTKAEADRTKRAWVRQYSGLNREPAYLYGGLEWHPITVNPDESQFIETRQHQAGQMAGLFRVPPHMVGDVSKSTSWGTGIEEQGLGFAVYTLGPWITRLEQAMSFLLPRGEYAKMNVGALLRAKITERYQAYATGRQWGWLSVNDIRELEDLAPVADGDIYLQPLNMIEASSALDALMASKVGAAPSAGDGGGGAESSSADGGLDDVDGIDPVAAATLLQKLYLATPKKIVVSTDEARRLARRAGIDLDDGIPDELNPATPALPEPDPEEDDDGEA
jgi:HK97 family phage portal protein